MNTFQHTTCITMSYLSCLVAVLLFCLTGCATNKPIQLMPAPVIYHKTKVDPYAHLQQEEKTTSVPVFYATNREAKDSDYGIQYGNRVSDFLHLGKSHVRFGDHLTTWDDLYLASTSAEHNIPINVRLVGTDEMVRIKSDDLFSAQLNGSVSLDSYAALINKELEKAIDKEIIIYVHGAKGSFVKSVALTAEIDHFSGRDFIGLAYTWPSHQNILSYVTGSDVKRAKHSTASLRTLIEFLAEYTDVKYINVICYSAGGRLVSLALDEMRQKYGLLDAESLKKRFKLGTVLFAAADVSVDQFLNRLPGISELAQQVVVTVSDADDALHYAGLLMGGNDRVGTNLAEQREEDFALEHNINNFEIVDFSFGSDERGFDITGHHYWHRHPWASSDIIFLLRTDLTAKDRGLNSSDADGIWYLSGAYPHRVRDAALQALQGEW